MVSSRVYDDKEASDRSVATLEVTDREAQNAHTVPSTCSSRGCGLVGSASLSDSLHTGDLPEAGPTGTVKKNVLPWPDVLSTHT